VDHLEITWSQSGYPFQLPAVDWGHSFSGQRGEETVIEDQVPGQGKKIEANLVIESPQ